MCDHRDICLFRISPVLMFTLFILIAFFFFLHSTWYLRVYNFRYKLQPSDLEAAELPSAHCSLGVSALLYSETGETCVMVKLMFWWAVEEQHMSCLETLPWHFPPEFPLVYLADLYCPRSLVVHFAHMTNTNTRWWRFLEIRLVGRSQWHKPAMQCMTLWWHQSSVSRYIEHACGARTRWRLCSDHIMCPSGLSPWVYSKLDGICNSPCSTITPQPRNFSPFLLKLCLYESVTGLWWASGIRVS